MLTLVKSFFLLTLPTSKRIMTRRHGDMMKLMKCESQEQKFKKMKIKKTCRTRSCKRGRMFFRNTKK